jgi:hypothetical protein
MEVDTNNKSVTKSFNNEEEYQKSENKKVTNNLITNDAPKLSQNAQKLKDLEEKMTTLEVIFVNLNFNIGCTSRNEIKPTRK